MEALDAVSTQPVTYDDESDDNATSAASVHHEAAHSEDDPELSAHNQDFRALSLQLYAGTADVAACQSGAGAEI